MKSKLILTGIAAAMLTASLGAQAADLVTPAYKAPAYVAPLAANWTGFYVGINGGYGFGTSDWDAPAVSIDPSGMMAGVTVGYNLQTGQWVWGFEGDFDWSDIKGDANCGPGTCQTKNDWFGTARMRIGYAGWDNWMPYFTGGAAIANVKANYLGTEGSSMQIGWTAGVGLEYAFLSNWSFKVEYLYADLGNFECDCGPPGNEVSFQANLVRAGLNYRF